MKVIVNLSAIASFIIGFYKMFVYNEYTNVYVGADAYNILINGSYTIAFFILGLTLVLISCTMSIMEAIKNEKTIEE